MSSLRKVCSSDIKQSHDAHLSTESHFNEGLKIHSSQVKLLIPLMRFALCKEQTAQAKRNAFCKIMVYFLLLLRL